MGTVLKIAKTITMLLLLNNLAMRVNLEYNTKLKSRSAFNVSTDRQPSVITVTQLCFTLTTYRFRIHLLRLGLWKILGLLLHGHVLGQLLLHGSLLELLLLGQWLLLQKHLLLESLLETHLLMLLLLLLVWLV